ncbi:MAG TPA: alpha/beta fold hydrolase [Actinomycetota bacterium]
MTDQPVLIPTTVGPIGGMVSEPEGGAKAAAVLLAGVGGRRFGVNRLWTELAWDLVGQGYVVLRVDYPGGQGDSSLATKDGSPGPFREVVGWFRERTSGLPIALIGSCFGARLAATAGAREPQVLGVGFITPTFVRWKQRKANGNGDGSSSLADRVRRRLKKKVGRVAPLALDPRLAAAVSATLERTRVWAVVGEKDHRSRTDLSRLQTMLQKQGREGFQVDEIPGTILHTQPSLHGQRTTRERVVEWATRLLDQVDQEVVGS